VQINRANQICGRYIFPDSKIHSLSSFHHPAQILLSRLQVEFLSGLEICFWVRRGASSREKIGIKNRKGLFHDFIFAGMCNEFLYFQFWVLKYFSA
jgi:hypothetical protein